MHLTAALSDRGDGEWSSLLGCLEGWARRIPGGTSWRGTGCWWRDGEATGLAAMSTGGSVLIVEVAQGTCYSIRRCPGLRAEQIQAQRRFWRGLAMPAALPAFHNTASNQLPPQP